MTINAQSTGRQNLRQIAPGLHDTTNRYSEVVYEVQVAQRRDVQDRVRRSHEELRAEEGLGWQSEYADAFASGTSGVGEGRYETRTAGQAAGRSKLGAGQMVPAWSTVDDYHGAFASAEAGDQGPGTPFARRGGAVNARTHSPLDGLARGERPSSIVIRQQAVPGRRPNEARVLD